MWFEDLKRDLRSVVAEVNSFAGFGASEAKMDAVASLLQIDNYRKACMDNTDNEELKKQHEGFIRKGTVGDWKNSKTSEETKRRLIEWAKKNLEGSDIPMNVK